MRKGLPRFVVFIMCDDVVGTCSWSAGMAGKGEMKKKKKMGRGGRKKRGGGGGGGLGGGNTSFLGLRTPAHPLRVVGELQRYLFAQIIVQARSL